MTCMLHWICYVRCRAGRKRCRIAGRLRCIAARRHGSGADLGRADDRYDRSYIYLPSIAQHDQNIHVPDWAVLIELTRDAWLATKEVAPERARRAAENWCSAPYPVFRRLALFAATQEDVIPPRRGLDWMLAHDHWWLWSVKPTAKRCGC